MNLYFRAPVATWIRQLAHWFRIGRYNGSMPFHIGFASVDTMEACHFILVDTMEACHFILVDTMEACHFILVDTMEACHFILVLQAKLHLKLFI